MTELLKKRRTTKETDLSNLIGSRLNSFASQIEKASDDVLKFCSDSETTFSSGQNIFSDISDFDNTVAKFKENVWMKFGQMFKSNGQFQKFKSVITREILVEIMKYLAIEELIPLRLVSKMFNLAFMEPKSLTNYTFVCKNDLPSVETYHSYINYVINRPGCLNSISIENSSNRMEADISFFIQCFSLDSKPLVNVKKFVVGSHFLSCSMEIQQVLPKVMPNILHVKFTGLTRERDHSAQYQFLSCFKDLKSIYVEKIEKTKKKTGRKKNTFGKMNVMDTFHSSGNDSISMGENSSDFIPHHLNNLEYYRGGLNSQDFEYLSKLKNLKDLVIMKLIVNKKKTPKGAKRMKKNRDRMRFPSPIKTFSSLMNRNIKRSNGERSSYLNLKDDNSENEFDFNNSDISMTEEVEFFDKLERLTFRGEISREILHFFKKCCGFRKLQVLRVSKKTEFVLKAFSPIILQNLIGLYLSQGEENEGEINRKKFKNLFFNLKILYCTHKIFSSIPKKCRGGIQKLHVVGKVGVKSDSSLNYMVDINDNSGDDFSWGDDSNTNDEIKDNDMSLISLQGLKKIEILILEKLNLPKVLDMNEQENLESFSNMRKLKIIDCEKIEKFILKNNPKYDFFKSLELINLKNLIFVEIKQNSITNIVVNCLPMVLQVKNNNSQLRKMKLGKVDRIKIFDVSIESEFIKKFQLKLKNNRRKSDDFKFDKCRFDIPACEELVINNINWIKEFTKNCFFCYWNFKKLNIKLEIENIGKRIKYENLKFLFDYQNLESLKLNNFRFIESDEEEYCFSNGMSNKNKKIGICLKNVKELELISCDFQIEKISQIFPSIKKLVLKNCEFLCQSNSLNLINLESLVIDSRNNDFGNEEIKVIGGIILNKKNKKLDSLIIRLNKITVLKNGKNEKNKINNMNIMGENNLPLIISCSRIKFKNFNIENFMGVKYSNVIKFCLTLNLYEEEFLSFDNLKKYLVNVSNCLNPKMRFFELVLEDSIIKGKEKQSWTFEKQEIEHILEIIKKEKRKMEIISISFASNLLRNIEVGELLDIRKKFKRENVQVFFKCVEPIYRFEEIESSWDL